MSRTDKTKPFWVKLAHGDLCSVEEHDHTDGRCDLPPITDAVAFTYGTTQCRRDFHYTGINTCCCPLCHSPREPKAKKRRREGRQASRNWQAEWGHDWNGNVCRCDQCAWHFFYDEIPYWEGKELGWSLWAG